MMTRLPISIRLLPDRHCLGGCAAPMFVEERTGLCLDHFHLYLLTRDRVSKLETTAAEKFTKSVNDLLSLDSEQVEEATGWRKLLQGRKKGL